MKSIQNPDKGPDFDSETHLKLTIQKRPSRTAKKISFKLKKGSHPIPLKALAPPGSHL